MKVGDKYYRTIWWEGEGLVKVIDQRFLPHRFVVEELRTVKEMATAIKDMHVRGAGLIGAAAAYGMYLATIEHSGKDDLTKAAQLLKSTRPTAVNLEWAVNRMMKAIEVATGEEKIEIARKTALMIADEDAAHCRRIGEHGAALFQQLASKKKRRINILTHCNAGWLAFVDHGSATAPIYKAFRDGIDLHVWVDETRPRNQGAGLTAWELLQEGIPHTVITDNAGGHLMQHGKVDLVITGADRVSRCGDAANKIGTYLKALAASDNDIPFYVALPSSSFDWNISDGVREIPIEERNADEVKYMEGLCGEEIKKILVTPKDSPAANFGFDVTPSRLITALITERGICRASEDAIMNLFAERIPA